jgi:uncharacterized protein YvpB
MGDVNAHKKIAAAFLFLFFAVLGVNAYITQDEKNQPAQVAKNVMKEKEPEQELEAVQITEKEQVLLDVPLIEQMPELPRGCEVTSLAMLLKYAGVSADKMELADRIKRDPTAYEKKNGQVYFGHPNTGFVGDMYSLDHPGLGVYHIPIKELAEQYLPGRIIDMTGGEFSEIEESISNGIPVWIITNSRYQTLPEEEFQTWQTPSGEIEITYREHSVVVTGYDENNVFFNDPLTGEKNKKVAKQDFIDAWVQMGRQTITYL